MFVNLLHISEPTFLSFIDQPIVLRLELLTLLNATPCTLFCICCVVCHRVYTVCCWCTHSFGEIFSPHRCTCLFLIMKRIKLWNSASILGLDDNCSNCAILLCAYWQVAAHKRAWVTVTDGIWKKKNYTNSCKKKKILFLFNLCLLV